MGTLIGAFIIAVIKNGMNLTNIASYTQMVVHGLVILAAVLVDRLLERVPGREGLSEAFYIPTALALIADHHASAMRSRAVGIHQIGIYLGVILGSLGVGIVVGTKSLPPAVLFLMLFGVGWGFFDTNNMPFLSQIVRPDQRAAGYGLMNLASISCCGLADVGLGWLVLGIRPHEKT